MTDKFPDPRLYLWQSFRRHMSGRKPCYSGACDVLRLLEGHKNTLCGKIIIWPFYREKRNAISA